MSKLEFQEEWLSAYLDDELTDEQRQVVEQRLATDPAAQSMLEDLRRVRSMVAGMPTWKGAPIPFAIPEGIPGSDDDFGQDEDTELDDHAGLDDRAGSDHQHDQLDQDRFETPIRAVDLDLGNRISYRNLMTWLATAASVLLAVGLAYFYWPSGSLMLSRADLSTETAAPGPTTEAMTAPMAAPATDATLMDVPSQPNSETLALENAAMLGMETHQGQTKDPAGMAMDKAISESAIAQGANRPGNVAENTLAENAMRGLGGEVGAPGTAGFGANLQSAQGMGGMGGMGAPAAPGSSYQLDVPQDPAANASTANSEAASQDFAQALPPRSMSASDALPPGANNRLNFSAPNHNATGNAPPIASPPTESNVDASPKAKATDPTELPAPSDRTQMRGALPPASSTRAGENLQPSPLGAEPTENKMRAENLGEPSQDTVRSDLQDSKKEQKQIAAPIVWFARSANWMESDLQQSLPLANNYVGNALPSSRFTQPSGGAAASVENLPPQPEVIIATVKAPSAEAVPYFDSLIASNQLTKLDEVANQFGEPSRPTINQENATAPADTTTATTDSVQALGSLGKGLQGNTLVLFVTRAEADQILSGLQQNEQMASQVWRVQQRPATTVNPAWDYRFTDNADAAKQPSDPGNQPPRDAAGKSAQVPKFAPNSAVDPAKPVQPNAPAENDKVILLLNGLPQ